METLIIGIVIGCGTVVYNLGNVIYNVIQNRRARKQGKTIAQTQAQHTAVIAQVQTDIQSIVKAFSPQNVAGLEQAITDTFDALKASPEGPHFDKIVSLITQHKAGLLGSINFATIEEYAQKACAISEQCDQMIASARAIKEAPSVAISNVEIK